jgi:plastocyanin
MGPGVNMDSSVSEPEELVWTVTFTDGKYTYFCDEHPISMHGSFTVGIVPEPTKVSGTVGPRRTISVLPKTITTGSVTLTVNDRSRTDNFHLIGQSVNRKTGIAFRGRVVWKLELRPGLYTYRSDAHTKVRGKLTVTATG